MRGLGRVFHVPACSLWRATPLPAKALSSPEPVANGPLSCKEGKISCLFTVGEKIFAEGPSLMNNEGIKGLQQPQQMCFMLSASFFHCALLALGARGTDKWLRVTPALPRSHREQLAGAAGEGCSQPPSTSTHTGVPLRGSSPASLQREMHPQPFQASPKAEPGRSPPTKKGPIMALQALQAPNERGVWISLLVLLKCPQSQLVAPAVGMSCHGNLQMPFSDSGCLTHG